MKVPIYHVDAFAAKPFEGNPAAVCLLAEQRPAGWMQSLAAEMNLSETAFVLPTGDGFDLRWFTPAIEVELCGHATLASAHVLWAESIVPRNVPIHFQTKSGLLSCAENGELIELNFPATPAAEADPPAGLLEALRIRPSFVGSSKFDKLLLVASEAVERSPFRLHLALLRAGRWHRRSPGDWFRSLLPWTFLGRAAGKVRVDRLPGICARWRCTNAPQRRSRDSWRTGCHCLQRRTYTVDPAYLKLLFAYDDWANRQSLEPLQQELLRLFAGRKGHFRLESGHHGDLWLDLELLCLRPALVRPFALELSQRIAEQNVEAVCGPLIEGAFVALMVASELNVEFSYSEPLPPQNDALFPVTYRIPPALRGQVRGKRVAIINDVINAGSAVRGTFLDLKVCGAEPVVISSLLVLGSSAQTFAAENNVRLESIAALPSALWTPAECPLCVAGIPLDNPVG